MFCTTPALRQAAKEQHKTHESTNYENQSKNVATKKFVTIRNNYQYYHLSSKGMSLPALVLMLIVSSQQVSCRTHGLRPGPSVSLQAAAQPLPELEQEQEAQMDNSYDQLGDIRSSLEMSTLMMDLMQRAAEQKQHKQLDLQRQLEKYLQQQQQLQEDLLTDESNRATSEVASGGLLSDPEPQLSGAKRGSYMSLCHFKICNMGRKRTLQNAVRPQWTRM